MPILSSMAPPSRTARRAGRRVEGETSAISPFWAEHKCEALVIPPVARCRWSELERKRLFEETLPSGPVSEPLAHCVVPPPARSLARGTNGRFPENAGGSSRSEPGNRSTAFERTALSSRTGRVQLSGGIPRISCRHDLRSQRGVSNNS